MTASSSCGSGAVASASRSSKVSLTGISSGLETATTRGEGGIVDRVARSPAPGWRSGRRARAPRTCAACAGSRRRGRTPARRRSRGRRARRPGCGARAGRAPRACPCRAARACPESPSRRRGTACSGAEQARGAGTLTQQVLLHRALRVDRDAEQAGQPTRTARSVVVAARRRQVGDDRPRPRRARRRARARRATVVLPTPPLPVHEDEAAL